MCTGTGNDNDNAHHSSHFLRVLQMENQSFPFFIVVIFVVKPPQCLRNCRRRRYYVYDYCYYYYICIIIIILCNAFEMSFTRDIAAERNALKKKKYAAPLRLRVLYIYICISIFIDDSKVPEICRCILYTLRRC